MTRIETEEELKSRDRLKRAWEHIKRRLARDNKPDPDCTTGPPSTEGLRHDDLLRFIEGLW